jgi:DUF4097 and DUF4098 domain-containing protein YvlB
MKEEIRRIMQLVKEGKLSPEDAADLIEAFGEVSTAEEAPTADAETSGGPPPPPSDARRPLGDPLSSLIESIEKLGKDVASSVNWQDVASQIKSSTKKGVDALRVAAEQLRQGKGFPFFSVAEQRELTLPLHLTKGKTLRIENANGDVRVFGGAESDAVTARATVRGQTQEDARTKADQYSLLVEESDHLVLIKQPDMTGLSVDLEIYVKGKQAIEIKSSAGDVQVAGTKAGCRISGKSGDVRLSGLDGVIEVSTSSGDVSVSDSSTAALSIENKSGDVRVAQVRGNVSVRSSSGDITLTECAGKSISLEAVSGDVSADLVEAVDGSVNIRTVSGDVKLAIPDGSDCRVALSTLRGSVESDLTLSDEARQEQRITGRLGTGTGTVDVSAINGNVHLALRDSVVV